MTRKEWVEKNLPAWINENADGGVIGCPNWYRELARIDPSVLTNKTCIKRPRDESFNVCKECWNTELNVKEERSKNMTRKEWMLKNHPNAVGDGYRGRVLACPHTYSDLAAIEKLSTAVFHLKAQHLTDEMVRKIFDEEPKESK